MNNAGVQGGRVRATMRAIAVRGPVGALLCATVFGAPVPARADVVAYFGGIASNTINAPANPPATPQENRPVLAVDMAAVHVAMYDAIVAIEGGYEPFAVIPNSPAAGASPEAAAATAACAVLGAFFPSRSAYYSDACSGYLNGLPADAATAMGKTLGKEVADAVVSLRADDGRSVAFNYLPGSGPGDFRPNPPNSQPAGWFFPYMMPYALKSLAQFRADGPPPLDSATYAADFNEVKAMGRAGGALLTADEKELARFHTDNPSLYQARNFPRFMSDSRPAVENARLMAMLWVALADAQLACFESKYHFDSWRPRTAIPEADLDGNPATEAEAGWAPFVPTPNHPEYPAAHGCAGGALSETVRHFFGTKKVAFDFYSAASQTTRHFDTTDDYIKESMEARIYGGMHFRTSTVHGKVLGTKVGHWVTQNFFRPVVHGAGGKRP